MGYQRPRKTIRLVFEDPDLAGLEVRAYSVSLGKAMSLSRQANRLRSGEADEAEAEALFRTFSDALIGWNLEDEGEPVPATYESLMDQDTDFALSLMLNWLDGVMSINAPLSERSSGGGPSPAGVPEALSIPMERLSASLSS